MAKARWQRAGGRDGRRDPDPEHDDLGFIVRTAGFGKAKTELKRDLSYLLRLWKNIEERMATGSGPTELAVESDLVIRTLRDIVTSDIKRVIVDVVTTTRLRDGNDEPALHQS